jgi:DNA gyrase subunit A
LAVKIKEYLAILSSRERIMGIIADELNEVKTNFAVPRRTEII